MYNTTTILIEAMSKDSIMSTIIFNISILVCGYFIGCLVVDLFTDATKLYKKVLATLKKKHEERKESNKSEKEKENHEEEY